MPKRSITRMIPAPLQPLARRVKNAGVLIRYRGNRSEAKAAHELSYWRSLPESERADFARFERYYTTTFGLDRSFYDEKRVLDLGCGPRGNLEWATNAEETVGLDPLVEGYRELGIDRHRMRYVAAPAEKMPLPDDYFDVVTTFNSLDHVDDLHKTVAEIKRVTKPGGTVLVLVEASHTPTITEPLMIEWDLATKGFRGFTVIAERRLEMSQPGFYDSVDANVPYDDATKEHEGLLLLHLEKPA
jgi:SAM-dependent methyltransferase